MAQLNPCQPWVSLSDALLSELVQLFDDGQFSHNVINILVQIAADALNLNCFILQSNQGTQQHPFKHEPLCSINKEQKIQKVIPWPQGFIKFHANTDEQDVPLDLSKKSENSSSQQFASQQFENTIEDVHYVYSEVINEDKEIIYLQNINENEGRDEPTAPGKVNTPDHTIQHEEFVTGNEENKENDQMEQNGLSEKEIQDTLKNIKQGKRFPVWLYRGMVAEEVEKVPQDINGMKLYKIPASDDTWGDLTADCQYFVMQTSSRSTLFGT